MSVHIANLREYDVDPTGNIVDRNGPSTSIKTMTRVSKQWRIVPNSDIPNTANHPTLEEYLKLEDALGFAFGGMIGSHQVLTFCSAGVGSAVNQENRIDAFGRQVVSEPFTLFDSQHRYAENEYWDTVTSGSGSKSHSTNESCINLNVTTASGDEVIRETKRVFPYQPGKSLLIFNSFVFSSPKENLRQRIGYFGANNGVYLEHDGQELKFVLRSSVTGSIEEFSASQSNWNVDKFDGNGISQIELDISKANLFWIDFEWLGVGDIRCGFIANNRQYVAHIFYNGNVNTTTYMTTATLPLRFEIKNTGTTSSSSTAKQICNTVLSEGGYDQKSVIHYGQNSIDPATLVASGQIQPIVSIRLASGKLDSVIVPAMIDALCLETNQYAKIDLIRNSTLTRSGGAALTWNLSQDGVVELNRDANMISSGEIIYTFFLAGKTAEQIPELNFDYQLGRTISGTSDIITCAATPSQGNLKVLALLGWMHLI